MPLDDHAIGGTLPVLVESKPDRALISLVGVEGNRLDVRLEHWRFG